MWVAPYWAVFLHLKAPREVGVASIGGIFDGDLRSYAMGGLEQDGGAASDLVCPLKLATTLGRKVRQPGDVIAIPDWRNTSPTGWFEESGDGVSF